MRYLSPPLTHAERMALVREARTYMGVRWRHQGRDRRGLDCAGLVVASLRGIGRAVRDSTAYGRVPYRGSLEAVLRDNLGDALCIGQM
jgi:cell wall-associated NlpC family hydrolase